MVDIDDEVFATRLETIQRACQGQITTQSAAATLAGITISDDTHLEARLGRLWVISLLVAVQRPQYHDKLVEILLSLSDLADAVDDGGDVLCLSGARVWADMPLFARHLWDFWEDSKSKEDFKNINNFIATLMATERETFHFTLFAITTFREALETPGEECAEKVAGAASWIEILGVLLYTLDEIFPSSYKRGSPGRGGALWTGVHGFCKERWRLWRTRFTELASSTLFLDIESRQAAEEAAVIMAEIEAGDLY